MKDLETQLAEILDEYKDELTDNLLAELESAGKDAITNLKRNSPKSKNGRRHYANGWTLNLEKSWKGIELVIYNKNKPQLTHILNDGFTMRNGQRHKGDGHIDDAEKLAIDEVERGIKNL